MNQKWKGLGKVFRFTFAQQMKTKSYRVMTAVLLLLCLLLPAGIMAAAELFGGSEGGSAEAPAVQTVYVADRTGEEPVSFDVLNQIGKEGFSDLVYRDCGADVQQAEALANEDPASLILVMDRDESGYQLHVLTPEESQLTDTDTSGLEELLRSGFSLILIQKSGLNPLQLLQMAAPTETAVVTMGEEAQKDSMDILKMVLSIVLPFLNIMALYFLVLLYGQSVANSVIMEKTSKLMDTFLVSVKPGALMFGKVLAIVLSSILQFAAWIAALAVSFAAGAVIVRAINPDTQMTILKFFDGLSVFSGMFSLPGIILALLMVFAGFLLYCSIAAIGGSIAGKPEDLSSTNVLFVMILIISFFCTLYAGGIEGIGTGSGNSAWLNWVPFTSIMVTPSRILLGEVSLTEGVISLAIVLLTSGVVLALAGRVYRMMSLFKGNPPSIGKMFRMLREQQTEGVPE